MKPGYCMTWCCYRGKGSPLEVSFNRIDKLKMFLFYFTGIHPTTISESFEKAAAKALEMLTAMSTPVALSDRESLLKSAMTSLSSKVK